MTLPLRGAGMGCGRVGQCCRTNLAPTKLRVFGVTVQKSIQFLPYPAVFLILRCG